MSGYIKHSGLLSVKNKGRKIEIATRARFGKKISSSNRQAGIGAIKYEYYDSKYEASELGEIHAMNHTRFV